MDGPIFTKSNEGLRLTAYQDSLGWWTIGYGHKLSQDGEGTIWSEDQANAVFAADYETAVNGAIADVGAVCWNRLSEERQAVLADMAFELGEEGLGAFHKMIAAILNEDWIGASVALLSSLYAQQVPKRAAANAIMLRTGEWQNA